MGFDHSKADGDLNFNVGDRIEIVKRTQTAEDWWTGRLDGREGVFPGKSMAQFFFLSGGTRVKLTTRPGNYVQDA